MKELILDDGDLTFETDETILGFENKLINALQVYGVECFYDLNNGLNFDIISSNQTNYKIQHIKNKILDWFGGVLEELNFKDIKIVGKVVKVTIEYRHKTLGKHEREVNI